jgi:Mrp family chromosome partitioning ATPase
MSTENTIGSRSAHMIVVGNEKGGSGKSTIAMHIAVALIKSGQSVATIDLDSRQRSPIILITDALGLSTLVATSKSPTIFVSVRTITRRMPQDARRSPMPLMHWRKATALL